MSRLIDADKLKEYLRNRLKKAEEEFACEEAKKIAKHTTKLLCDDVDAQETVEAIPVDWLMKKADWCDKNNGIFVSGAIRYAVDAWREEQNNGIDKS